MDKIIEGNKSVSGVVKVPGDKSISHRAVILGSIANGKSEIKGISTSSDVKATIGALKNIGININVQDENTVVEGVGITGFENMGSAEPVNINCGNSGTTARLFIGLLSGAGIKARLTGDSSLSRRPMMRVVEPLTKIGAHIKTEDGYLPVVLEGQKLVPFDYNLPIPSAQVKSSLMLAALFIHGSSVIKESIETRDHTERMLLLMDGDIKIMNLVQGKDILISGRKELTPLGLTVPGDISSAVFFIASALITPSSELIIEDVLLNRTRAHIIEVFRRMGGEIEVEILDEFPEPIGNVRVRSSQLRGTTVSGFEVPLIIDEIPALAACSFFAMGDTVIRGAGELRVKESDRIKGIVYMVEQFGGKVEELEDGFIIHGGNNPNEAEVQSFQDHRLAMASSIIALNVKGKTVVKGAECVNVSFPGFFEIFEKCIVS